MDGTLELPTILVGLGPFGTRVVRRLLDEREELVTERVAGPPLASVLAAEPADAEALAAQVLAGAKEVLAHARMVVARDARGRDGPTRLHVLVLAHLGEAETRGVLASALSAIERRLLAELGPIFEPYRTGAERNLVLLPLLAMPHPAGCAQGADVVRVVRSLCASISATPPRRRALAQLFLIEDVAEFSILSEPELEQSLRNFATLLLYSLSAVDHATELIYGLQPREPLATFACAVAELPRRRLAAYATDRVALELLDALVAEEGEEVSLPDIDAIEEVEFADFDEPRDATRDILALLDRYAPRVARDPEPAWWERSETTRDRYGPDPADASLERPQPSPEAPVGWALERMREIEKTWRMLQRRRFDDVIARERDEVHHVRDGILGRLEKRVDQSLWSDTSPASFRKTATLVRQLERAVSLRLEDAIRERDAAVPVPPPSFDSFRHAHAGLLDALRAKPDLGRMMLYGVLALGAVVTFGPMVLGALATALGIGETDWQSPWLRERGWLTSALVGGVWIGAYAGLRYRRGWLRARSAFQHMYEALGETVSGLEDSVLEYFASRLALARQVARVDALLNVRAAISRDSATLTLIDRAARRARGRLLEAQRALGVRRDAAGRTDISRLLGARVEPLVESLVPPDSLRFIDRLLPAAARDARVQDVLGSLARDEGYARRWREEAPFTSIEALRRAAEPHAREVAEWDPFTDGEAAGATARHIAAFARRQARSLHVALNLSGHEMKDETGTTRALDGVALVPPAVFGDVRALLDAEGAGGRATIPTAQGVDRDRAYYVLTVGDIALRAVPSLDLDGSPKGAPEARDEAGTKPAGSDR